jgi:hypothetical protein
MNDSARPAPGDDQSVSASQGAPVPSDTAMLVACGHDVCTYLARVRRLLDEEIRAYPTPIPRCDAQFNHLYEQRTRAAQLLERMNAAMNTPEDRDTLVNTLDDFVHATPDPQGADPQALVSRIKSALKRA